MDSDKFRWEKVGMGAEEKIKARWQTEVLFATALCSNVQVTVLN